MFAGMKRMSGMMAAACAAEDSSCGHTVTAVVDTSALVSISFLAVWLLRIWILSIMSAIA